jgi:hypothetical protein
MGVDFMEFKAEVSSQGYGMGHGWPDDGNLAPSADGPETIRERDANG